MPRIIVVAIVAALFVGCGGSSGLSQADVEQRTWQYVKDQVGFDVSVDDFGCIRDGDSSHWKCLSTVHPKAGGSQQVSVLVTCDSGDCLFEPS